MKLNNQSSTPIQTAVDRELTMEELGTVAGGAHGDGTGGGTGGGGGKGTGGGDGLGWLRNLIRTIFH